MPSLSPLYIYIYSAYICLCVHVWSCRGDILDATVAAVVHHTWPHIMQLMLAASLVGGNVPSKLRGRARDKKPRISFQLPHSRP